MKSIQRRLALVSIVVLLSFLSLTGLILERTYRNNVVASVQQELQPVIYALMGVAQERQGALTFSSNLSQPRLQQPNSGLYALVIGGTDVNGTDAENEAGWRSPSLAMADAALAEQIGQFAQQANIAAAQRLIFAPSTGVANLYCLSNRVDWEGLREPSVAFVLCADQTPYRQSMTQFRYELIAAFGALSLILSLLLLIVLRWGLRPLRHIRQQLLQLEQGDLQSLDAVQPLELAPLVESLNQYIAHQSTLRNRHRQSLDDLSHSLKTPLSVLRLGVAELHPDLDLLQEQVARMQSIVDHQLSRVARIAQAEAASEQPWVSIDGVIRKLLRALAVAYPSHQFDYLASDDWQLRIHEDDLLDMLGNVMENACKYGHGQVRVSLRAGNEQRQASASEVQICIEDDGPGIASEAMDSVLRRGARVDSREAGHGIGLAMVAQLLEIYTGDMVIAASSLGGAKVILGFQQARLVSASTAS